MDIPSLVRTIIGIIAVLLSVTLLYLLWRFYIYFFLEKGKRRESEESEPSTDDNYHYPEYIYDNKTHEFFAKSGE